MATNNAINLKDSGLASYDGAGTFAGRTIQQPAAGITVADGNGVSGDPTLALADDLAAVEGLSGSGVVTRTGASAWATNTIADRSVVVGDAGNTVQGIGPLADGELLIGGTGLDPAAAALTAGTAVSITNAANSITVNFDISGAGDIATTFTADSGSATPSTNSLAISGGNAITTSGAGATITIAADAATTSAAGVQENATDAEAIAVTATDRTVTPSNLAAVFASPPALGSTAAAAVDSTTLTSTVTSATTNAPITVQTIEANTSGTAAAGIGPRQVWRSEDGGGGLQDIGYIDCIEDVVTAASETSTFRISAITAGSVAEVVRFGDSGISTNSGTAFFKYQEGTWTPQFNRTGITFGYSNQEGYYIKVGKCCHVSAKINVSSATGSGSGNLTLTALPFTSYNGSSHDQGFTTVSGTGLTAGNIWIAVVTNNTTTVLFGVWQNSGVNTFAVTPGSTSANWMTGTYSTAS